MVTRISILMISQVLIIGCNRGNDDMDVVLHNPASDTTSDAESGDDPCSANPFADIDCNAIAKGEPIEPTKTVDYQAGDLVPCSVDRAAFVLEIKAMNGGNCFYRREQGFQRYDDGDDDPRIEHWVTQENLVCAMLVNGFASGTLQYTDLATDSVTVKIHWKVSSGNDEEEFAGEFTARIEESGTADAGRGNVFAWSLWRKG